MIPVFEGLAVQSQGFRRFLPIGRPDVSVEYLSKWDADEIMLVDISATRNARCVDPWLVHTASRRCHVPLTVGGGISSVAECRQILAAGADKIVLNSALAANPRLVRDIADEFGRQCIVASVDVRRQFDDPMNYQAYTHGGQRPTRSPLDEWLAALQEHGVGEILLQSIDRDGSRMGYDMELVSLVAPVVSCPLILAGGAGHPEHLEVLLSDQRVSGAAIGNMLNYTEHALVTLRTRLRQVGCDLRRAGTIDYGGFHFDELGRVEKLPDQVLSEMLFEHFEEDVP